jgi:hypothetical protein
MEKKAEEVKNYQIVLQKVRELVSVSNARSNEILGWVGVGKIKPFRTLKKKTKSTTIDVSNAFPAQDFIWTRDIFTTYLLLLVTATSHFWIPKYFSDFVNMQHITRGDDS